MPRLPLLTADRSRDRAINCNAIADISRREKEIEKDETYDDDDDGTERSAPRDYKRYNGDEMRTVGGIFRLIVHTVGRPAESTAGGPSSVSATSEHSPRAISALLNGVLFEVLIRRRAATCRGRANEKITPLARFYFLFFLSDTCVTRSLAQREFPTRENRRLIAKDWEKCSECGTDERIFLCNSRLLKRGK